MKYIIVVPDGMSGLPVEELNDRTCMEAANTPNMDMIARKGIAGVTNNTPKGMIPASDVANLSILGYDPEKYYSGRGPLEAANLGVELGANDVAFRFNTVTVGQDKMVDYSAGHISSEESVLLVEALDKELSSEKFSFFPGTSYRNLLLVHCASDEEADKLSELECFPPHNISDKSVSKHLPKNAELVDLMERSKNILEEHDINKVRVDLGQNPANMIWVWGQGRNPDIPKFEDAYGIDGGIISAVDLLKGIGHLIGLEVAEVQGATGYYDTNFAGKAQAALDILDRKALVFVHIEAPDEAGHNGDILAKVKAIENIDNIVIANIIKGLEGKDYDYRIMVLPDHPTPVKKKMHTNDPVPVAIAGKGITPDDVTVYTEKAAKAGSLKINKGWELMKFLLGRM